MDEDQINQLNFDMLNGQEKHIKLPYKQIIILKLILRIICQKIH